MPQLRASIEYSCNLVVNSNIKLGKLKLRQIFKLSDVDSPIQIIIVDLVLL